MQNIHVHVTIAGRVQGALTIGTVAVKKKVPIKSKVKLVSTEHHRYFLVNQATCQDNWTTIERRLLFRTVPTIWFARSKYGNEPETIQP